MTVPAPDASADRQVQLADLTTLRLGGPAGDLVEAHDEASLVEAVSSAEGTHPAISWASSASPRWTDAVSSPRSRSARIASSTCRGEWPRMSGP